MAFETMLGLVMLSTAAAGFTAYKFFTNINWPLVWFCLRGDV